VVVDRPEQVLLSAADLKVRFVHAPLTTDRRAVGTGCGKEARRKRAHPIVDRAGIHHDAALREPFGDIGVTEPIAQLPADSQGDHLPGESVSAEGRARPFGATALASPAAVHLTALAIPPCLRELLPRALHTLHPTLPSPYCWAIVYRTSPLPNETTPRYRASKEGGTLLTGPRSSRSTFHPCRHVTER
jgi:hypothetical protein